MFFETLKSVFDTFGPYFFVPVVLFGVAKILGVKTKKAFTSAIYAGIGLQGFTLLINSFMPIITPVVQRLVNITGIDLPILDIGWQATSLVAYSTEVGMVFVGLAILIQTVLFLTKWTNIFQPGDLWNNYSYMVWGSMIYLITGNMYLSVAAMTVLVLYTLLFAEMSEKRWSEYYGYPNCTIASLHTVSATPLAILMDWILNKLGLNNIKINPDTLQDRLGFMGEPVMLGLILGIIISVFGNFNRIGTLAAWGEIALVGITVAAVMAIFPKIAGIFAQAFTSLTEATKKKAKNSDGLMGRKWYLAINDATGFGEPATLISGILLIPIMVLMAVLLPGNKVLPLVDLIAIPFIIQTIIAITRGNIFKSVIIGTVWFSLGLYVATYTAPMFTQVATSIGVEIPAGGLMVTSFVILTNPFAALIFAAFLSKSVIWISTVIGVYLLGYIWMKKNRGNLHNYLDNINIDEEELEIKTA
jgi:PTS system galactitol-specific IIC component